MDLSGKHSVKILGQIGYYVVLTCKVTSGTLVHLFLGRSILLTLVRGSYYRPRDADGFRGRYYSRKI
jgi:hypothetical protein